MTKYYLKRSVCSPVFGVCVVLLTFMMVIGCSEDLTYAKDNVMSVLYLLKITNSIGIAHVMVPLIVSLPFLFYAADEVEKGARYFSLIRTSNWRDLFGRMTAAMVSSMLVALLSCVLFTLICMGFGAKWQANENMISDFERTYFKDMIQTNFSLVYGIHVLAFCLYSLPWVLIGIVASFFAKNKYLIYASPFVVFNVVNYVFNFFSQYWLNISVTLLKGRVTELFLGGLGYAAAYHGIFCTLLIGSCVWITGRRWRHEGL